jgi:ABC-2 type transport system permease protein
MAHITMSPGVQEDQGLGLTQARVAYSEWVKLRSLRSTVVTLTASVVVTVGTGLLVCLITKAHQAGAGQPNTNAATLSLYGAYFAPLTVGVLGVLLITGEYATGMIRATLSAVPRRLPVLWAKLAVFAAVTLATSEAALFVAFLAGQVLLARKHAGVSLAAPGVLGAVAGTGLYMMGVGLLGMALGFLIRNTAGAISTLLGLVLVLPVLVNVLPAGWTGHLAPYLPNSAGQAIMLVMPTSGFLAPWAGLGVFTAYIAVAIAAAAVSLAKRDA